MLSPQELSENSGDISYVNGVSISFQKYIAKWRAERSNSNRFRRGTGRSRSAELREEYSSLAFQLQEEFGNLEVVSPE